MAITRHHRFIGAIAALSILITGFGTVQAQARDHSAERTVAAILGLAVVGAIIAQKSDKPHRVEKVVPRPQPVQTRPLPRDIQRQIKPHHAQPPRQHVQPRGHAQKKRGLGRG